MVPTGNTFLFMTVGLLLCSTSYTGVNGACKTTKTAIFPSLSVKCSKDCFRTSAFTCKPCPPPCVTCHNSTHCKECVDERWGPVCDRNCTNCVKRLCSIHTGSCLYGCENGFYALLDPGRCVKCPPNCEDCSSSRCYNCKPGFTGNHCKKRCPPNCKVCSLTECSNCKPGFAGKLCEVECALCEKGECSLNGCREGCIDGYFSSNSTKSCQKCPHGCISCTSWQNCTSCVSGYHGRSCEHICSRFCHNATCEKTTGECTDGCKDRSYKDHLQCVECPHCGSCHTAECQSSCCEVTTQPVCEVINCKTCRANNTRFCAECLNGYYVTKNGSCEQCSPKCKYKTCYPNNGTCISGCIDGWKGPHCTEDLCTEKGYYRDKNNCLGCPPCSTCRTAVCVSSCCEVTTPSICEVINCKTCGANNTRLCAECLDGHYVTNNGGCEQCSPKCKNKTCYPNNGTCISGCIDGWKGLHCTEDLCAEKGYYRDQNKCSSCPPCSSCRTAACISSCCEVTTPSVCDVKSCETCRANDPRFCVECSNGSYVTDMGTCEPCSQHCIDRTCDPYNGTCLLGCMDGWKGPYCKDSACANSSCDVNTINQQRSGNRDESGENSMVIGAAIGSAIFVLVVVVIATIILLRRKKRVQQKPNSPVQTEAEATDASTYYNITSSSNNRSVIETTNQNTEMQTLPESCEYVNVDNIGNTINTYEALGKRDEHIYAKNTYEALGSRDEDHLYSKNSYEALGARDEHTYGNAEEPIYVNKT